MEGGTSKMPIRGSARRLLKPGDGPRCERSINHLGRVNARILRAHAVLAELEKIHPHAALLLHGAVPARLRW